MPPKKTLKRKIALPVIEINEHGISSTHTSQNDNAGDQLQRKRKLGLVANPGTFASSAQLPPEAGSCGLQTELVVLTDPTFRIHEGSGFAGLGDGPSISLQELDEVQSHSPLGDDTTFTTGPSNVREASFEISDSPLVHAVGIPPFFTELNSENILSLTDKLYSAFIGDLEKHARCVRPSSLRNSF